MRRYVFALRNTALALAVASISAIGAGRAAAQQTASIRGTVTDAGSGAVISGAQVFVVGTGLGSLSDDRGAYAIGNIPAGSATVRVEHIGYAPLERQVTLTAGQTATVNFQVASQAVGLDEIVVVGYGTRTRRELSTSVASVQAAQVQNVPVAGLDAALQGKAPGMQVIQNAGNPGNGITVRIRGAASLSASNQPLWVVDGVPVLQGNYSQGFGSGGQDLTAISNLNPDEIESIDILKDAAAAAIYGSRASNGVVLVTTKRGKANQSRTTFSLYTGIQRVPREVPLLNAQQYVDFINEAAINDGEDPPFSQSDIKADTNWQDAVFRTAPVSDLNIGMSGGSDRVQYYLSGSYFDQTGIVIGSRYNRAAGRVNLDFKANDRLSFSTSLGLTRENNHRVEGDGTLAGVVTNALANPAILPVKWPDGTFTTVDDGLEYVNSVAMATYTDYSAVTNRVLGKLEGTLDLGGGLSWRSQASADVLNLHDFRYDGPQVVGTHASSVGGESRDASTTADRYLLESYLSLDRPTGDLGNLSLTGGASVEWNKKEWNSLQGEHFPSPSFHYIGNAGTVTNFDAGLTDYNLVSFFSRANYEMKGRYFFSGAFRVDGSSRFGANNRYGIFPAGSFGWGLSDEPFMEGLKSLATVKLRASFGETGNQDLNDAYASLGRFGAANYGDEPGIAPTDIANPGLKWETTREFDVGADVSTPGGRVSFTADYYRKNTDDLLVQRPITSTSGYTSLWANIGSIANRGWELSLNTVNVQPSAGSFGWTTDFNISFNHNEVTALYESQPFNQGIRSINRVEVGQPLGAFYALRFDGVDPQTGNAIFYDANGDGKINSADRVIVGKPNPDYWGGFGNTFTLGGLSLRSFFQFSQGAKIFYATRMFGDDGGYYFDQKFGWVLDRWQKPGDITDVPRASYDDTSGSRVVSSRYIEDASYIRLQELTLSWQLPQAIASKTRMRDASLFVTGHNLHLWTHYRGYDPDVNSGGSDANVALGTDYYAYPLARTISFGIRGSW